MKALNTYRQCLGPPRVSRLPSRKAPNCRPSSSLKESHPCLEKSPILRLHERNLFPRL
ncbi:Hypothetical protein FKW44_012085 [Caligus rogercresseyi]|uniref:Uncharacterized protein n=1 Tax=Caligus rogercresseyi TaxID=217165 RepID=A0A7T8KA53_CALRO|nr:Hypothetical protein FKW44_012085 [Caligus rogercresseyi]